MSLAAQQTGLISNLYHLINLGWIAHELNDAELILFLLR